MTTLVRIAAALAVLFCATEASAQGTGPSPYVNAASSPFASIAGFIYFHLENFEDLLLNTPGVTANPGTGATSTFAYSGTVIDSVRDDGLPTGTCPQVSAPTPCESYYGDGATGITFTFNPGSLGGLPTHVGIVWADGVGANVTVTFTGPGGTLGTLTGTNIGDGSFFGATAEDRFFGWTDAGGISSVTITDPGGGLEVDHLQYGRLAAPVPSMPTVVLLLTAALLLTIGVRRLRPRLA